MAPDTLEGGHLAEVYCLRAAGAKGEEQCVVSTAKEANKDARRLEAGFWPHLSQEIGGFGLGGQLSRPQRHRGERHGQRGLRGREL